MTNTQQERDLIDVAARLHSAVQGLTHYVANETNPDRKRQAAAVLTTLKAAQASLRELWFSYDDVPF